ncbi:MAG: major capsid protein [Malazfec virus 3]
MEATLGGDRLGSGNKQKIEMKNYERSSHDLSYIWRSTMSAGTLVPFMSEVGLPGDSFDIDLDVDIKTHPTIGPLFGSYKIQLDVFQIPVRLYQGKLHMNQLEIGRRMDLVKLPLIEMRARSPKLNLGNLDNQQINPSCIFSYLNIRGLGTNLTGESAVTRQFNAVPYLGYFDIFKNYYANKQEDNAFIIHNDLSVTTAVIDEVRLFSNNNSYVVPIESASVLETVFLNTQYETKVVVGFTTYDNTLDPSKIEILVYEELMPLTELFSQFFWDDTNETLTATGFLNPQNIMYNAPVFVEHYVYNAQPQVFGETRPRLQAFPLKNIDLMREAVLTWTDQADAFVVSLTEQNLEPYIYPLKELYVPSPEGFYYSKQSNQEGLLLKTYQSDLFNNWVNTEWIDGEDGINEITKIITTDESFNIDQLILNRKIYDMLMRISVSGGSYYDWIETVYTNGSPRRMDSPMYMGGLIRELAFQEVISNAESGTQPLGTLAGRGIMTGKNKGGKIQVRVEEPSYIMGIISLTPRIDYSQGNKWDVNLKTMDDFHKPQMDEIGFQDLITDQMAWWDTEYNDIDDQLIFKSAGKQPAWINYMTNVNQIRGNFAEESQQMFMTLNRRYEPKQTGQTDSAFDIKDLTTYIDPSKFNNIFAETRLDAQNFWTQIKVDIFARRKMSAKVMPNL